MVTARAADIRRIHVDEYYSLADQGWFTDERVELLEGVIFKMSPQRSAHAFAVTELTMLLVAAVSSRRYKVRVQLPLTLSEFSEPEPDLAVVTTASMEKAAGMRHPSSAVLVVEVADTTLRKDRSKAALYAAAGIAEYWLVNVAHRSVEVMRSPEAGRYRRHQVVTRGALRTSLIPRLSVDVADLWPAS